MRLQLLVHIQEKMPFLIDFAVDERRSLPKMGDKSCGFVGQGLVLASQAPTSCRAASTSTNIAAILSWPGNWSRCAGDAVIRQPPGGWLPGFASGRPQQTLGPETSLLPCSDRQAGLTSGMVMMPASLSKPCCCRQLNWRCQA